MKNLIKNTLLAFSFLGLVSLSACGQAEKKQDDTANRTTKVEKKVEEKISVEQEKNTTLNTSSTTNPLAAVTDENTKTIKIEKVKTLTKPVNVATETSTVSLGAEQADDDLFSIDLAGDDLAAANAEETELNTVISAKKQKTKEIDNEGKKLDRTNNDKRKTSEVLDTEIKKLQKTVSDLTGAKGELDTRYSIPTLTPDEQSALAQKKFNKTPEQLDKEIKAGKYGKIKNEDGSDFGVSDFLAFVNTEEALADNPQAAQDKDFKASPVRLRYYHKKQLKSYNFFSFVSNLKNTIFHFGFLCI